MGTVIYGIDVEDRDANHAEVMAFIGEQPKCPVCDDLAEFEGEYGPEGCDPCNSRLYWFEDYRGKRVGADYGDRIERHPDGLHLLTAAQLEEIGFGYGLSCPTQG